MIDKEYGGGTVIGLCESLRNLVAEATKNLKLETENLGAEHKAPRIVNGFLPPKRATDEPENPFIIIRPKDGRISDDGTYKVNVRIIVGVYSEEFDGHEYALIVFQRITQAIQESQVLTKRYRLEYPLTWEMFDEQPYPFWAIVGTTQWLVPAPVQLLDREVL